MGGSGSGYLWIDGDWIRCRAPWGDWGLPVEDLRALGEYTTSAGPYLDDYFFVFVFCQRREAAYHLASHYASGRDVAFAELGKRLGVSLRPTLAASTSFDSNVLWPSDLAGEPAVDIQRVPRSGLAGVLDLFAPRKAVILTPAVVRRAGCTAIAT